MEIVFATDFSDSAQAAAGVAVDYARRFGARLHLLYVGWAGTDPTMPATLERLAAEMSTTLRVVTSVEFGAPAAEIVRYAQRNGIDLIVLGTHGRTGVSRALLGSVAERVVRTAPCPVLTVPMARPPVAATPPEATQPGHCAACAAPSEDLICSACRARIRDDAVGHKRREERSGRE